MAGVLAGSACFGLVGLSAWQLWKCYDEKDPTFKEIIAKSVKDVQNGTYPITPANEYELQCIAEGDQERLFEAVVNEWTPTHFGE